MGLDRLGRGIGEFGHIHRGFMSWTNSSREILVGRIISFMGSWGITVKEFDRSEKLMVYLLFLLVDILEVIGR